MAIAVVVHIEAGLCLRAQMYGILRHLLSGFRRRRVFGGAWPS